MSSLFFIVLEENNLKDIQIIHVYRLFDMAKTESHISYEKIGNRKWWDIPGCALEDYDTAERLRKELLSEFPTLNLKIAEISLTIKEVL